MNRLVLNEIVELTKECLKKFFRLDHDFFLSHCDEDISCVGQLYNQFFNGLEEVKAEMLAFKKEQKPCRLLLQDFFAARISSNSCTVFGRYIVTTDESSGYFFAGYAKMLVYLEQGRQRV